MPLQPKATGYNRAYVRMWYGDGKFRETHGARLDGLKVKLAVAITPLKRKNQTMFLVDALPADEPELNWKRDADPALNWLF